MPPELAAIPCAALIVYLFWRELREPHIEKISWVPFVWMFIAASRFPSRWLNLAGPGSGDGTDGSAFDRTIFLSLIILGAIVLYRRRVAWGGLLVRNKWLVLYFAYCLLSIFWADEQFVLFKRWFKDLGSPIMALILLTERHAYDALATTIRRISLIFLPLSVLFIKYYPHLGRIHALSGAPTYTGAADQKNTLGLTCLIITFCYLWSYLYRRDAIPSLRHRYHLLVMGMTAWLFWKANSQTAFLCLLIGVAILLLSRRPMITRQPLRLVGTVLVCTLAYVVADATFGVKDRVFMALGRDSTLTNRTGIWEAVNSVETNPAVGVGFMSFWQGERRETVNAALGPHTSLNQAHNGYLEQYVNLGYIGVAFIIGIALLSLIRISKDLATDYASATLRFAFVVLALLYNYTEASFYGINNIWLLFLMVSIRLPKAANVAVAAQEAARRVDWRRRPRAPQAALARARRVAVARSGVR
jgi:O-antigen ligase